MRGNRRRVRMPDELRPIISPLLNVASGEPQGGDPFLTCYKDFWKGCGDGFLRMMI
jgi:hypothetical protein